MKMMKNILSRLLLISVFLLILSPAGISQTSPNKQAEIKRINKMTEKLKVKLLLSDSQVSSVKTILNDYFASVSSEVQSPSGKGKLNLIRETADTKINKLLDKRQEMKFSIVHDEWWDLAQN